jgi:nicotinamide riboside kinase
LTRYNVFWRERGFVCLGINPKLHAHAAFVKLSCTKAFSQYYHATVLPHLVELAEQCTSRYDFVFLCDTDIPYDDTWDRSGDTNRQIFQKQIIGDLLVRKIPYFVLSGDLETRVTKVKNVLSRFQKYKNLLEPFL